MRISIKHALMAAIVGVVAVTVTVMLVTSHVTAEHALVDQMRTIVADDAHEAAQRTRALLNTPESAARVAASLFSRGSLTPDDVPAIEQHFRSILDELSQVAGVYVGTSDGGFVYVSRATEVDGAATRTKVIDVTGPRSTTLTWYSENGAVVAAESDPADTFDPRTRPWYEVGMSPDSSWTEPYVFFTSQRPGISTASAFVVDGVQVGVVGLDVELAGISHFLADLKTSPNSSAIILNRDMTVVAHPTFDVVTTDGADEVRYLTLSEIGDPLAEQAFGSPRGGTLTGYAEAMPVVFDLDGAPHQGYITPLGKPDLPWVISVSAPQSDYLGLVERGQRTNLQLAVLIGLAALVAAYLLASALSRPIRALAERARAVTRGSTELEAVSTRFREIDDTVAALQSAYGEFDRRVVDRTVALAEEVTVRKAAEERALAASRAKSDFLASVTHELRTPLTGIVGFAELLESHSDRLSEAERRENLGVIRESGRYLLELINELLDLARIEAGETSLEEQQVDVRSIAEGVARLLSPESRHVRVSIEGEGLMVRADPRRVRQILLNLMGNAIKFTPEGGSVVTVIQTRNERAEIVVEDTGVGMSADEIEIARRRFGRSQETDRPGSGLGLALTEQMAIAHGGGLEIESSKGEGTRVVVWFPAERIINP